MSLLEVKNISLHFGGIKAVDNVSFQIAKNSLSGLIGPNGAGKTTVFNSLTGVYQPQKGEIIFAGQSVIGKKPHQIAAFGLSRTFQNIRLFKNLTVLENVLIAAQTKRPYGFMDSLFQTKKFFEIESSLKKQALELLSLFGLADKQTEISSSLPYGEQRKLEIVRALATQPQLLLLDEPAAGMNHKETHDLMDLIARIRKEFSISILLIEHDMKLVMGICENIVVLDHGTKIEEGTPQVIQKSQKVIEAYLGSDDESTAST